MVATPTCYDFLMGRPSLHLGPARDTSQPTRHSQVQRILLDLRTGVDVEIRVSLTWRAADNHPDGAAVLDEARLTWRRRLAHVAVHQVLNPAQMAPFRQGRFTSRCRLGSPGTRCLFGRALVVPVLFWPPSGPSLKVLIVDQPSAIRVATAIVSKPATPTSTVRHGSDDLKTSTRVGDRG